MMEDGNDDSTINRRNILRSAATGTAATATLIGTATARSSDTEAGFVSDEEIEEATEQYQNPGTVRREFKEQTDLLESAYEEGYLESPSVGALDIGPEGDDTVEYDAFRQNGTIVPEIRVKKDIDEETLVLVVRPEQDSTYAYVDTETTGFSTATEDEIVTIQSCNCWCKDGGCDDNEECVCWWQSVHGGYRCRGSCDCVEDCPDGWV